MQVTAVTAAMVEALGLVVVEAQQAQTEWATQARAETVLQVMY